MAVAQRRSGLAVWIATAAAASLVLLAWMTTAGSWDLTRWQRAGDFYDAQAASFLDGRWDVPADVLGIEAFEHAGRAYMYQGPVPALLRLPVVAVTDRYQGRLTQLSMLLAAAATAAGLGALAGDARRRAGLPRRVPRWEGAVWAATTFVLAGGTSLLFNGSKPWVYHEAIAWGVAGALGGLVVIGRLAERPSRPRLALAVALTVATLLSRASIGLAPLAGLGLVALARVIRSRRLDGWAVACGAGALGAVAAYAAVNYAKFGTLFSIPFHRQGFTAVSEERRRMLAETGGTLFGAEFAPTTALHYLRPDGIRLSSAFPWVDFPGPARVVGGAPFDLVDHAGSIPATLLGPAVATVVAAVVARRVWGLVLAAGAMGFAMVIPFGYVAHRYLADTYPLFAVGSVATVAWACAGRRAALLGGLAALGAVTLWVNLALGLQYQGALAPDVPPDVAASLARRQPPRVQLVQTLPPRGERHQVVAAGDCHGLYRSDGQPVGELRLTNWFPVEQSAGAGRRRVVVPVPDRRRPVLAGGVLWIQPAAGGRVRFGTDAHGVHASSRAWPVGGAGIELDVAADPYLHRLVVRLGDVLAFDTLYLGGPGVRVAAGLRERPVPRATLCRELVAART